MGESTEDSSDYEDKMPETATPPGAALQVSVSFSRFENDALSWERFSTFSPNKYLEEVEKCATLGSVAEKRAYFEAHYKKIADGKAESMDQERKIRNENLRSPRDLNSGDLTRNPFGDSVAYHTSNNQNAKAFEQETDLFGEVSTNHAEESDGDASIVISSAVTGMNEELDDRSNIPRFHRMAREEAHKIEPKNITDQPQNMDSETGNAMKTTDVNVNSDHPKASSHKITAAHKEKNTPLVKKKSASPVTKATQFSTPRASKPAPIKAQQISTPRVSKSTPTKAPQFSSPRVSKPAPTPTVMRSSTKKEHASSIARKKDQSAGDSKRAPPESLHISLVVDRDNLARSDRKSLIMERMGDKDIVKRAFKTFQNNFNHLKSYSEERSSVPEQGSAKGTELTVSGTMTMHKDNGGSIKVSGVEKGNSKAAPSSFEKPQKHKEYSLKLEEKSNLGQVQPKFKKGSKNQTYQRDLGSFG